MRNWGIVWKLLLSNVYMISVTALLNQYITNFTSFQCRISSLNKSRTLKDAVTLPSWSRIDPLLIFYWSLIDSLIDLLLILLLISYWSRIDPLLIPYWSLIDSLIDLLLILLLIPYWSHIDPILILYWSLIDILLIL